MTTRRHWMLAGALALGLPAAALAQGGGLVGISMPEKVTARWVADGDNMVKDFEAAGYQTDLQYANDDIPAQLSQIENMVTKGAKALVIASIDGTTLSDVLKQAGEQGIKVIAYDRLIRDSDAVSYYATFDNFKVGVEQANTLVEGLKERFPDVKPWNVELFGGSPDDNNAFFFYDGAMSVLQPLIDAGEIAVQPRMIANASAALTIYLKPDVRRTAVHFPHWKLALSISRNSSTTCMRASVAPSCSAWCASGAVSATPGRRLTTAAGLPASAWQR